MSRARAWKQAHAPPPPSGPTPNPQRLHAQGTEIDRVNRPCPRPGVCDSKKMTPRPCGMRRRGKRIDRIFLSSMALEPNGNLVVIICANASSATNRKCQACSLRNMMATQGIATETPQQKLHPKNARRMQRKCSEIYQCYEAIWSMFTCAYEILQCVLDTCLIQHLQAHTPRRPPLEVLQTAG